MKSIHDTNYAYTLGRAAAYQGKSDKDNPYCPGGELYDGADSMGDAIMWWYGWKNQSDPGHLILRGEAEKAIVDRSDIDYLFEARD